MASSSRAPSIAVMWRCLLVLAFALSPSLAPSLARADVARSKRVAHAETREDREARREWPPEEDEPLDPDGAVIYSLGGLVVFGGMTVIGHRYDGSDTYQIGWIGTFIAPSFGQWYARRFWTTGLTARALGALIAYVSYERPFHNGREVIGGDAGTSRKLGFALGCALFAGGTIADIVTGPGEVRKYNREKFGRKMIVPTVDRGSAGISLVGTF